MHTTVNFSLTKFLAQELAVRSKGWNRCVMLFGTFTRRMLFSLRSSSTGGVIGILGTFFDIKSQDTDQNHEESLVRKRKQPKTTSAPKNQVKSTDIRDLFKQSGQGDVQIPKKKQKIDVVNLDDSDSN